MASTTKAETLKNAKKEAINLLTAEAQKIGQKMLASSLGKLDIVFLINAAMLVLIFI